MQFLVILTKFHEASEAFQEVSRGFQGHYRGFQMGFKSIKGSGDLRCFEEVSRGISEGFRQVVSGPF